MTALQSTQRRLTTITAGVTLAAVVVLAVLGVTGVRALKRYEGATKVEVTTIDLPPTDVGMLATVDEVDRLTSVTVFVVRPETQGGVGGSIVSVPIAADTTFGSGDARVSLVDAYAEAGAADFGSVVESLLSLTFDYWEVANAPAASALLAPVGTAQVEFPSPVVDTVGETSTTLYEAGSAELSVSALVDALEATVPGLPESARRANVEALWSGIAESVGDGITSVSDDAPVDSLGTLLDRLFAGPVQARGLLTALVDPADNPMSVDVVALDRADVVMVFGSIAPNSTSAPAPGLVFRIEAPTGYDDRVRFAISAVLYFGGNVQSVLVADNVPREDATVFEIYDPRFEERTEDSAALFGTVRFSQPATQITGVDAVIRLGDEFLNGNVSGLPASTTTSVAP